MARAGHPPPVVISAQGGVTIPTCPPGLPLGVGQASFEAVELELPEGSVLALYTDGLVERRDEDIEAGMLGPAPSSHSRTAPWKNCARPSSAPFPPRRSSTTPPCSWPGHARSVPHR
ncbi:PP2C family protein-serine/threonine phosphatase [Streptomyces spiralis]|uniref:PP2C family protein-serine/threonine phosphatase n=1 Tax=Streptomyces spiralis TaxID=66376 RepID=UPI003682C12A